MHWHVSDHQAKYQNHVSSTKMGEIPVHDRLWTSAGEAEAVFMSSGLFPKKCVVVLYAMPKLSRFWYLQQRKNILQKVLPDMLKISIARNIENDSFTKVILNQVAFLFVSCNWIRNCMFQVSFLAGLHEIAEIQTLFSAEVSHLSVFFIVCFD